VLFREGIVLKLDITSIIKDNGGSIKISMNEKLSDLETDLGTISFTSPVDFAGSVTNNNGMLDLKGIAKVNYSTVCDRCGDKIDKELVVTIDEDIIERAQAENESEESFEDDRFTFSGNVLELNRIVADNVLTSVPMTHICQTDCPGLCPLCGAMMKGAHCDCERSGPVDSRFEALKGFFD
jgi:uncharacterized protein